MYRLSWSSYSIKQAKHESRIYSCEKCNYETKWCADIKEHVRNKHFSPWRKKEGEAFKSDIDDKLKNTDEHDDEEDVNNDNDENPDARNTTKDTEIEIDDANDENEVNDEENDKKKYVSYANAKNNKVENDDKKDSTEVDNEGEHDQNYTKEVHYDECDEKTKDTTSPIRKLNMKTYLRIVTN